MAIGIINIEALAEYDGMRAESTPYYEEVDYNQIQKSVQQPVLVEEKKSKAAKESEDETSIKIPKEDEIHYMEVSVNEENHYMAMDAFKTKNNNLK